MRPLSLETASANSSEGNEHLGFFCWVLNAEPPMCCKYVTSLWKAVFSIAHVPKYAVYSSTACDFNNSQSLFLVLCYITKYQFCDSIAKDQFILKTKY